MRRSGRHHHDAPHLAHGVERLDAPGKQRLSAHGQELFAAWVAEALSGAAGHDDRSDARLFVDAAVRLGGLGDRHRRGVGEQRPHRLDDDRRLDHGVAQLESRPRVFLGVYHGRPYPFLPHMRYRLSTRIGGLLTPISPSFSGSRWNVVHKRLQAPVLAHDVLHRVGGDGRRPREGPEAQGRHHAVLVEVIIAEYVGDACRGRHLSGAEGVELPANAVGVLLRRVRGVVADGQRELLVHAAGELLELAAHHLVVGAELGHERAQARGGLEQQLEAPVHAGDVGEGHEVVELKAREPREQGVEGVAARLERDHELVDLVTELLGAAQLEAAATDVDVHVRAALRDRDDHGVGHHGHARGGTVAHAGLGGRHGGVGVQVEVGAQDRGEVLVDDDGTVHL